MKTPPRFPEDEMASEPWYSVGPNDIFPEEFASFLLGDPRIRKAFMKYHKELLDSEYWIEKQEKIRSGMLEDVFPYPQSIRFSRPVVTLAPDIPTDTVRDDQPCLDQGGLE